MNRVEELTLRLADGGLSDGEAAELRGLVAADLLARASHVRLLDVEAALRSRQSAPDLVPAIMSGLHAQRGETMPERVVAQIRTSRPARFRPRVTAALALAAGVLALLSLGLWYFGPTMGEPVLAAVNGTDVSLARDGVLISATNATRLQPADALRIGTNSAATITFGKEMTTIELSAGTELTLSSYARGKQFQMAEGSLSASVARQRPFRAMLVTTPNAQAKVIGTDFTLTATTKRTQLDVAEGKVRLTDTNRRTNVVVPAAHYAIVAAATELAALPQTGGILREFWTNLPGRAVNDLLDHPDYPDRPSGHDYVELLEVPTVGATNSGCRLVGYLHPPVTGQYIFWIAASPAAAVNLSRDEKPENAVRIFGLDYGRGQEPQPRQWGRNAFNSRAQSPPIPLVAGRRYYIEAAHKADGTGSHLAIAWTPPGGQREVIGRQYLSPLTPRPKEAK